MNLQKGVWMHKIDFALIFEESCKYYTSTYNKEDCIVIDDIPLCFIGLMGDRSPIPMLSNTFNNTYEFLDLFNDYGFIKNVKKLGKK